MRLTKKVRAMHVYHILDEESPSTITFLEQTDPFRLLISVILSAQTTDRQVNEVAVTLFDYYPDALSLARADAHTVKEIIRSTGYYQSKTNHIIGTAQEIVQRFNGQVPYDIEDLVSLPGVGRKTANVILGQLAGQPAIIVDTHFSRVVRRVGITSATTPEKIEREVASLLPPEYHYRFSMTVNLHGRQLCHARKPLCESCFIAPYCKSYPI